MLAYPSYRGTAAPSVWGGFGRWWGFSTPCSGWAPDPRCKSRVLGWLLQSEWAARAYWNSSTGTGDVSVVSFQGLWPGWICQAPGCLAAPFHPR